MKRRVAITGLGTINAVGISTEDFREGIFAGRCGIREVTQFDTRAFSCHLAGEVTGTNLDAGLDPELTKEISRCDILGLIAAREAIVDSGLDRSLYNQDRIGVVLGGGAGGMNSWEKYRRARWSGQDKPDPSLLLPYATCTLTDLIAGHYGFTGFRSTICTACSSSATSIGYGFDLIGSNTQDIVITGGSEALSELTFAGFHSLRLMDPEHCRPFDMNRRGLSLGEGAAILVLEDYDHAETRGATIYAEVLGYATNCDAVHMTAPDLKGMSSVMAQALKMSSVDMNQVDYINAHGTATPINDKTETAAIRDAFGEKLSRSLAISSTKSMIGHCLGAAGGLESIATILALYGQIMPPTIHLEENDPDCDLDYIPNQARKGDITIALKNSFAFGGNNTSIVFKRSGTNNG